ncbi:MAG: Hsp20/alpha crystallin family protein [Bacteroidales bacterium]|jgi:HSP20 family protein|nr:Hsp20/alpha crystallin family protein [Bacteroidales bacterium]
MTLVRTNNNTAENGLNNYFSSMLNRMINEDVNDLSPNKKFRPAVNILERENEFLMELVAPGMKKEDFRIKFEDDRLEVSAEVEEEQTDDQANYTRCEFSKGAFSRSFRISSEVIDSDKISATYENGILMLTLPKREEAKPKPAKEIAIK